MTDHHKGIIATSGELVAHGFYKSDEDVPSVLVDHAKKLVRREQRRKRKRRNRPSRQCRD